MTDASSRWFHPRPVDDLTLAFPARVIGVFLPPWDEIPDVYKTVGHPRVKEASDLFHRGGLDLSTPQAKQLLVCLASYEPKHEHKIAGVAWLLDLFGQASSDTLSPPFDDRTEDIRPPVLP